ncbi:PPA1309 family protein [Desertihabitans aurantiacus]|uniref:PPA1309 family protein n=1 Tax=Desertihabitans aurantiacus TaxID=2282477 RepID=UPI001E60F449|nr:PPA1309 family protein [Desertihabitans aurantiacus]
MPVTEPPDPADPDPVDADPTASDPAADTDPVRTALLAALVELERHVGEQGFDQAPRLFALVRTDDLVAAEPALAEHLGLRSTAEGGFPEALTPVEQEFAPGADLVGALSRIEWPATVHGCALACERSFLPAGDQAADVPDDPDEATTFVAEHPDRQDVRVVVGVLRSGHRHGVARLVSHPEDLLGASDLVPGLAEVLAYTLHPDEGLDGPDPRPHPAAEELSE